MAWHMYAPSTPLPLPQGRRLDGLFDIRYDAAPLEIRSLPRVVRRHRKRNTVAVPHLKCAGRDEAPRCLGSHKSRKPVLRGERRHHLRRAGRMLVHSDRFGDRYVLEFEITGPKGSGRLRSAWIIRRSERVPRLTSCFLK